MFHAVETGDDIELVDNVLQLHHSYGVEIASRDIIDVGMTGLPAHAAIHLIAEVVDKHYPAKSYSRAAD